MHQASKDSETMFDDSTFEDALDKVISLACKARGAEIDAGACRTRRDFDKMHKAQDAAQEAKDAFLARFSADVSARDLGRLQAALEAEQRKVAGLMSALKATVARLRNAKEAVANVSLILGDVD